MVQSLAGRDILKIEAVTSTRLDAALAHLCYLSDYHKAEKTRTNN